MMRWMDIDLLFCKVTYGGKINTNLLHHHDCGYICEAMQDMIQRFWHIMDVIQGVHDNLFPGVLHLS